MAHFGESLCRSLTMPWFETLLKVSGVWGFFPYYKLQNVSLGEHIVTYRILSSTIRVSTETGKPGK